MCYRMRVRYSEHCKWTWVEKCASAFDDKGAGNTVSKLAMQEDIFS